MFQRNQHRRTGAVVGHNGGFAHEITVRTACALIVLCTADFFTVRHAVHKTAVIELLEAAVRLDYAGSHADSMDGMLRSTRAFMLLKRGEICLQESDVAASVELIFKSVHFLQQNVLDGASTESEALFPSITCSCLYCRCNRSASADSGRQLPKSDKSELCVILSLCGWRYMGMTDYNIYMSGLIILWRCFANRSDQEAAALCPNNALVNRAGIWADIHNYLRVCADRNKLFSSTSAFTTKRKFPISFISCHYSDFVNYVNLLSIRALYPTSVSSDCDLTNERVQYQTLVSETLGICSFVSNSLLFDPIHRAQPLEEFEFKTLLEHSSMLEAISRYLLSVGHSMLLLLEINPFELVQTKPTYKLKKNTLRLYCNMQNTSYEAVWDDCLQVLTNGTMLMSKLRNIDSFDILLYPNKISEINNCFENVERKPNAVAVRLLCDLLDISIKLHYYRGIAMWHHEEWGLYESIRNFDAAISIYKVMIRLKESYEGCKEDLLPASKGELIFIGDIYFHSAQAVLTTGAAYCASDASLSIDCCISMYESSAAVDNIRKKHAWSLKCIIEGILKRAENAQKSLSEVENLILSRQEGDLIKIILHF